MNGGLIHHVGFLLSGPLGLEAARGLRILANAHPAIEFCVTIGSTPSMAMDYRESILEETKLASLAVFSKEDIQKKCNVLICIGWRTLISDTDPSTSVFVFHDSLLPRLRGWNPMVTALETQEQEAGISLILGTDEFDAGPIVAQWAFGVGITETIDSAIRKSGEAIRAMLEDFIGKLELAQVPSTEQEHSLATYSLWRDDEDYQIDWTLDAAGIDAFIRSRGWPYLGAMTTLDGKQVRILRASLVGNPKAIANPAPGKVISVGETGPVVTCGAGQMRLERIVDWEGNSVRISSVRTRFR